MAHHWNETATCEHEHEHAYSTFVWVSFNKKILYNANEIVLSAYGRGTIFFWFLFLRLDKLNSFSQKARDFYYAMQLTRMLCVCVCVHYAYQVSAHTCWFDRNKLWKKIGTRKQHHSFQWICLINLTGKRMNATNDRNMVRMLNWTIQCEKLNNWIDRTIQCFKCVDRHIHQLVNRFSRWFFAFFGGFGWDFDLVAW